MRAVVFDQVQGRPNVREVPAPAVTPGGVVVKVMATGLCRSDWHAWAGHEDIAFPHVPGHELAGIVTEVGADVVRWKTGDRVAVPFVCGCGRCEWCLTGNAQVCPNQQQPGFTHWGSAGRLRNWLAISAATTVAVARTRRGRLIGFLEVRPPGTPGSGTPGCFPRA